MTELNKDTHLQIRVSPTEKAMIARAAKRSGMSMSAWLLSRVLPSQQTKFQQLVTTLQINEHERNSYAELNDLLTDLSPALFSEVLEYKPGQKLSSFAWNYLTAMIELAAAQKGIAPPAWTRDIKPLARPYFGTTLGSLRLHLLIHSPAVFRHRNIFIDATLGDRV